MAAGFRLDQIAKSIIFRGEADGHAVLVLTAGGNRVDPDRAAALAGAALGTADAARIRAETGCAIGGAPLSAISARTAPGSPPGCASSTPLGRRRHPAHHLRGGSARHPEAVEHPDRRRHRLGRRGLRLAAEKPC